MTSAVAKSCCSFFFFFLPDLLISLSLCFNTTLLCIIACTFFFCFISFFDEILMSLVSKHCYGLMGNLATKIKMGRVFALQSILTWALVHQNDTSS